MAWSKGSGSLIAGGAMAVIGAHICCIGPLALLSFGIGGAWIGRMTAMEPYRPVFIGLTLLFLGMAFRRLYLAPRVCVSDIPCDSRTIKRQRGVFLAVVLASVPSLLFF